MSSKRYLQFQKQLQGDSDQPIAVILDNAKYHHSKETHFFAAQKELKESESPSLFPVYSTKLNSDEQFWHRAEKISHTPCCQPRSDETKFHINTSTNT
jgi:transposase